MATVSNKLEANRAYGGDFEGRLSISRKTQSHKSRWPAIVEPIDKRSGRHHSTDKSRARHRVEGGRAPIKAW